MSETTNIDAAWHHCINAHVDANRAHGGQWAEIKFMYGAKDAWNEARRLPLLFAAERTGALPNYHRQCSFQSPEPVEDNHLVCCLGVECRKCPHLIALDGPVQLTPEQRDEAKAWTCIAHILSSGGDTAGEGFILTTSDRMFWDRTYASLAEGLE